MTSWPKDAQPRTVRVSGKGTDQLVWEVPDGVVVALEAVYAAIDTGGVESEARVTIRDPTGAVIARKRPSAAIDANANGSATWALRLADDGGGGKGAGLPVPPWTVDYVTGEVTGATTPTGGGDFNKTPLAFLVNEPGVTRDVSKPFVNADVDVGDNGTIVALIRVEIDAGESATVTAENLDVTVADFGTATGLRVRAAGGDGSTVIGLDVSAQTNDGDNMYAARFRNGQVRIEDQLRAESVVRFTALPTVDPGVPGQLWNDAGAVKISL